MLDNLFSTILNIDLSWLGSIFTIYSSEAVDDTVTPLPKHVGDNRDSQNAFNEQSNANYLYQGLDITRVASGLGFKNLFLCPKTSEQSLFNNAIHNSIDNVIEGSDGVSFGIYNKDGNHWVAYAVVKDGNNTKILYKDSAPGKGSEFKEAVEGIYKDTDVNVEVIGHEGSEQKDAVSCGIFALKNLEVIKQQLESNKQQFIENFKEFDGFYIDSIGAPVKHSKTTEFVFSNSGIYNPYAVYVAKYSPKIYEGAFHGGLAKTRKELGQKYLEAVAVEMKQGNYNDIESELIDILKITKTPELEKQITDYLAQDNLVVSDNSASIDVKTEASSVGNGAGVGQAETNKKDSDSSFFSFSFLSSAYTKVSEFFSGMFMSKEKEAQEVEACPITSWDVGGQIGDIRLEEQNLPKIEGDWGRSLLTIPAEFDKTQTKVHFVLNTKTDDMQQKEPILSWDVAEWGDAQFKETDNLVFLGEDSQVKIQNYLMLEH